MLYCEVIQFVLKGTRVIERDMSYLPLSKKQARTFTGDSSLKGTLVTFRCHCNMLPIRGVFSANVIAH